MRKKLDPRLRYLLATLPPPDIGLAEESVAPAGGAVLSIEVLVRCTAESSLDDLKALGMQIHAETRGAHMVVAGEIRMDALSALSSLPWVREVEFPRPMQADLDLSRVETGVSAVQSDPSGPRGAGVVVGIVDSGIDFTHPSFLHPDGSSRILLLWDQAGPMIPNGPVPYGREYTKADLDQALADADPQSILPHQDRLGHGTHVAGIAAGNGAGGAEGFLGVAPEADLIVVSYASEGVTLGRSGRALAAIAYVVDRAAGRPVSINISQGMNGGGHCGETNLETGIDDLLRRPGVAVVKSAGNETGWQIHAGGQMGSSQTAALEIQLETNDHQDDILELWFSGEDAISVAAQAPGGAVSDFVAPGGEDMVQTSAGNQVQLSSDVDAAGTGDTRVTLILSRGTAPFLQPGVWKVHLRSGTVADGRYDAWIERTSRSPAGEQARFTAASTDESRTISIPGTAKRIITVGSYVTRPSAGEEASRGQVSRFSSRGPTRYGGLKPELAAPGEWIISCRSRASLAPEEPDSFHTVMAGTSMAAPHVTGAAALLLSVRSDLRCEQVKQVLLRSSRRDDFSISAPDGLWGNGKLDIAAALKRAGEARFPRILGVQVTGSVVRWQTEEPSTGAVRFHRHRRQLELGKSSGSEADLTLATEHAIDLAPRLKPGIPYFCEILAFDQDSWWAVDDAEGSYYEILLP
jgi:subtilisin family serine protease